MAHYIDGFVFPVSRDRLDEYKRLAEAIAEIWKEHGALDYREYVGDDLTLEGTRSFTDLVAAAESEVIVFGWVVFESREVRDAANKEVATDPRVAELVDSSDSGFDARRMAYGGFMSLVPLTDAGAGARPPAIRKIPEEKADLWSVWRQDDNGSEFMIASALTESEAKSFVKEFEGRGHKQVYWLRKEQD